MQRSAHIIIYNCLYSDRLILEYPKLYIVIFSVVSYFCLFSDVKPIVRNEGFRLFACMNPATDVGKKDLPPGIRNRYEN